MSGPTLAAAAMALVGCRFRLHGRDPASGLDCIGVLAAALAATGRPAPIPNGYTMRGHSLVRFAAMAGPLGFAKAADETCPGDVLLWRAGPGQFHLGIAAGAAGFVHAHAGLRRVVISPAAPKWQVAGHWRLAPAQRAATQQE